jgi:UrcA family protein
MKTSSITNYVGTGMLAFCATIGQAWMVSAAHAETAPDQQSLRIVVSDLDLNKSADVATLYARIKSAAVHACGTDVVTGSRLASGSKKQCLDQAVEGAVVQINNPSLTAYHKQESTKSGA